MKVLSTDRSFTSGIVVAALSCLIRPTGAILWIPVFMLHLYWMNTNDKLVYIIKLVALGYVQVSLSSVAKLSLGKHLPS